MALDDSLRRPQTEGFHCGERIDRVDDDDDDDDDDNGKISLSSSAIIFFCNVPPSSSSSSSLLSSPSAENDESMTPCIGTSGSKILEFHCREPSCGALEWNEPAAKWGTEEEEEEHHGMVDPNFFDEGYTMAGTTGFKVWTGTRLLIETLAWPRPATDSRRLLDVQRQVADGANVIELGAGVGVVGTYLAHLGANVLLTDLPTLVDNAIAPNVLRNSRASGGQNNPMPQDGPSWFQRRNGVRIGNGWAAWTPLDWTVPIDRQLSTAQFTSIDLIVASDVVFLVSMLDSLLDTVGALFEASSSNRSPPSLILSFQRRDARDGEESSAFTTVTRILKAVKDRGWTLECLSWRPVLVKKETNDGTTVDELSEVYVYEIRNGTVNENVPTS